MPRLRCPRCSAVVDVAAGAAPSCPACGFGSGPAARPPARAAPAALAAPLAPAAPAAPPAQAPAPYPPMGGARRQPRTGRTVAIVVAAVLVVGLASAVAFLLLKPGEASDLSEAEARGRVAASLEAAAGLFNGEAGADDLVKATATVEPPADGGAPEFPGAGDMDMTIEWGRDDAVRMRIDSTSGPVTVAFTMTCAQGRRAIEYGGEAYVSRPYVDGTPADCLGMGEDEMENGTAPSLDELDAEDADITVHGDGSVTAVLTEDGVSATLELDPKGRMRSMTSTTPEEGTWTMEFEYGSRRALTLPEGAQLMPAEAELSQDFDGSRQVWSVVSSPQEPPLSEIEVRVQPYGYGYGDFFGEDGGEGGADEGAGEAGDGGPGEVLSFPADRRGEQVQGNYTVRFDDADADGKLSAGDSFDVLDAGADGEDNPFGFAEYQVVLYDEAAKGELNGSPLGMPGPGWLALAALALGLAAFRRRR